MKGNYGIDAPEVVRNLFLLSFILMVIAIFSFYIPHKIRFWVVFLYSLSSSLTFLIMGLWMIYGIKIAKPRIVQKMLRNLELKGNEKVLDLGCGRGLVLCNIAKQLSDGEAHGIDLWLSKDQSGNSAEKALENADREGVKDKVTIHTGDICALPFPNNSFDVIISSLCLHNIKDQEGRERALQELIRTLKPGGKFVIADIQRTKEYRNFLIAHGMHLEDSETTYSYFPPVTIVRGITCLK